MAATQITSLVNLLREIAEAIRAVKETSDLINPRDFASLILSLKNETHATASILGQVLTDNTITLLRTLTSNGTYNLRYEDSSGVPLDNFSDICTLTVNDFDASYSDFINTNIPPYLAEQIGVYNLMGDKIGYIPITMFKPRFGERLYRFGLLSDVHDYTDSTALASDDFKHALNLFNNKEDVVMTCICGDISQNGTKSEFQVYKNDVAEQSPNTPVYTTTGNHDAQSGISTNTWKNYTGELPTFEKSYTVNGKTDHFLFLGMHKWNFTDAYATTDLDWLESKLEEYKNERCFVFTHLFFPDRSGNLNGIYTSNNWLSGSQLTRLENMCNTYVNSIWFSGHSHWKWEMQAFQKIANIYRTYNDDTPTCGWCVHVPSCAEPRITTTGSDRIDQPLESQGAIVDVYEDYIDIRGIDLITDKYIPIGTYRLDTVLFNSSNSGETENTNTIALTASNFFLSGSNEGNPTVTDEGEYLVINFDAVKNRLMFRTDAFTEEVTKAMLYHDGVELSATLDSTAASKVGFQTLYIQSGGTQTTTYSFESGSQLTYALDDTESIHHGKYTIQCNTSSSYAGAIPLTVRLKNPRIVLEY